MTPALVVPAPVDVHTQLKILIQEGRFSEAFQRVRGFCYLILSAVLLFYYNNRHCLCLI